jgi:alkylation response protein AidB-like acyl-CoA dehydrogenase
MIGDGPVDGRGKGMSQMFQMMNEERLNTGLFSLGVIGAAYYAALEYTKVRKQSPKFTDPKGPSVRIIEHEDVRRMLMYQKSCMEAIRALIYQTYYYVVHTPEISKKLFPPGTLPSACFLYAAFCCLFHESGALKNYLFFLQYCFNPALHYPFPGLGKQFLRRFCWRFAPALICEYD